MGISTQAAPLIPSDLLPLYRKWGSGLDWRLLAAIGKVESDHNPWAVNPSDPSAGVMGTQPLIVWVFGLGGNRFENFDRESMLTQVTGNADLGIKAGSGFLRELFTKHRSQFTEEEIIQMYNLGEPKVIAGIRNPDYLFSVNGGGVIGWWTRYRQEFPT